LSGIVAISIGSLEAYNYWYLIVLGLISFGVGALAWRTTMTGSKALAKYVRYERERERKKERREREREREKK
jgi:hypothetical protein